MVYKMRGNLATTESSRRCSALSISDVSSFKRRQNHWGSACMLKNPSILFVD
jgi:hypothetical protein